MLFFSPQWNSPPLKALQPQQLHIISARFGLFATWGLWSWDWPLKWQSNRILGNLLPLAGSMMSTIPSAGTHGWGLATSHAPSLGLPPSTPLLAETPPVWSHWATEVFSGLETSDIYWLGSWCHSPYASWSPPPELPPCSNRLHPGVLVKVWIFFLSPPPPHHLLVPPPELALSRTGLCERWQCAFKAFPVSYPSSSPCSQPASSDGGSPVLAVRRMLSAGEIWSAESMNHCFIHFSQWIQN